MGTSTKYLLFQNFQWLILALFLWFVVRHTPVNFWPAAGFLVFWILKDFAVYPLVRRAYENNAKSGTERLVGSKGVAHETLAPAGYSGKPNLKVAQ